MCEQTEYKSIEGIIEVYAVHPMWISIFPILPNAFSPQMRLHTLQGRFVNLDLGASHMFIYI